VLNVVAPGATLGAAVPVEKPKPPAFGVWPRPVAAPKGVGCCVKEPNSEGVAVLADPPNRLGVEEGAVAGAPKSEVVGAVVAAAGAPNRDVVGLAAGAAPKREGVVVGAFAAGAPNSPVAGVLVDVGAAAPNREGAPNAEGVVGATAPNVGVVGLA